MVQEFRHTYVDNHGLFNCIEIPCKSYTEKYLVAEKHSMQNYTMQDI